MYDAARATVMGDFKTLANRRADAIKAFQSYGVTQEQICSTLGVSGTDDIGLEKLVTLRGILTAIKEGDTTPEQAFANVDLPAVPPKMPQSKSAKAAEPAKAPESIVPPKTDELPLLEPKNESPLSEAQFDYLKMKLETAALSSTDIQRQFGFAMADITNANFNDVLAWIKNPAA